MRARARAFTLIEILVVVLVIGLLIALIIPAATYVREQARRANCASNLRQLFVAQRAYANDHLDLLPNGPPSTGSNWIWDQTYGARDAIVTGYLGGVSSPVLYNTGPYRHLWYCPSYTDKDVDALWNYNSNANQNYCVTGYVFFNPRPGGSVSAAVLADKPTYRQWQDTMACRYDSSRYVLGNVGGVGANDPHYAAPSTPSTIEFAVDGILSVPGTTNFVNVSANVTGVSWSNPFRTSHLDSRGTLPAGGNVAFFDGHAQWRAFGALQSPSLSTNMSVQWSGGPAGGQAAFWW